MCKPKERSFIIDIWCSYILRGILIASLSVAAPSRPRVVLEGAQHLLVTTTLELAMHESFVKR